MVERVLTDRHLNRALLARQLLLERTRLPVARAVERVGGLQAQYVPSAYIGLWSRMEGFERPQLTRALQRRAVVQGTLMRATIHIVSARDYALLAAGIRQGRRRWWLRVTRPTAGPRELEAAARRVRSFLAAGPRRRGEIDALLDSRELSAGVGLWIDLVRVPPSGTWERRRADVYATAADWLGASRVSPAEGIDHLVRRYLGAFGPAPPTDIAGWAGLAVSALAPALERLGLRRFRDEAGGVLLDLPSAPLPAPDAAAPVRFLGTWDAILLVHARRTGVLPERYRPRVFDTKNPHSVPTFLVDGAVAGRWKYERGRIELTPFGRLPRQARVELEDEAERLAAFHA